MAPLDDAALAALDEQTDVERVVTAAGARLADQEIDGWTGDGASWAMLASASQHDQTSPRHG